MREFLRIALLVTRGVLRGVGHSLCLVGILLCITIIGAVAGVIMIGTGLAFLAIGAALPVPDPPIGKAPEAMSAWGYLGSRIDKAPVLLALVGLWLWLQYKVPAPPPPAPPPAPASVQAAKVPVPPGLALPGPGGIDHPAHTGPIINLFPRQVGPFHRTSIQQVVPDVVRPTDPEKWTASYQTSGTEKLDLTISRFPPGPDANDRAFRMVDTFSGVYRFAQKAGKVMQDGRYVGMWIQGEDPQSRGGRMMYAAWSHGNLALLATPRYNGRGDEFRLLHEQAVRY